MSVKSVSSSTVTKEEIFPPITDVNNPTWLGIDEKGNVYLGKTYKSYKSYDSFNEEKTLHYFSCVKGSGLGGIWTGNWLPDGLKPFYGKITLISTSDGE